MYRLAQLARWLRWHDWAAGKVTILSSLLFYIGLANGQVGLSFAVDFLLFIFFAVTHSALGYVVNDWGDRELDAQHGKPNAFAHLTRTQGVLALAALFVVAFLSAMPFVMRPAVLPLWIAWVVFALSYSLKPLRLKERGAWGITVSFLAQWSVPILLAFAAFYRFGGWDMLVFVLAITINGATLEVAHQRHDRARDRSTATGTLGSRLSERRIDRLYALALLLDKLALGVVIVTLVLELPVLLIGQIALSPVWVLLAIYLILFLGAWRETVQASRRHELFDPYYSSGHSASKLLHETLPNLLIPGYLMLWATLLQPINAILLFAFLIWRLVLGRADWRWPLRALRARLTG